MFDFFFLFSLHRDFRSFKQQATGICLYMKPKAKVAPQHRQGETFLRGRATADHDTATLPLATRTHFC